MLNLSSPQRGDHSHVGISSSTSFHHAAPYFSRNFSKRWQPPFPGLSWERRAVPPPRRGRRPHLRILQHILVPLRIRALNRHQIKLIVFRDEPHRDGNRAARFSAGDGDLNFSISGKLVFQRIIVSWHVHLPASRYCRPFSNCMVLGASPLRARKRRSRVPRVSRFSRPGVFDVRGSRDFRDLDDTVTSNPPRSGTPPDPGHPTVLLYRECKKTGKPSQASPKSHVNAV